MIKIEYGRSELKGTFPQITAEICIILAHFREICSEHGIDADEEIALAVKLSGMSDEELKEDVSKNIEKSIVSFAENLVRAMENHTKEETQQADVTLAFML